MKNKMTLREYDRQTVQEIFTEYVKYATDEDGVKELVVKCLHEHRPRTMPKLMKHLQMNLSRMQEIKEALAAKNFTVEKIDGTYVLVDM